MCAREEFISVIYTHVYIGNVECYGRHRKWEIDLLLIAVYYLSNNKRKIWWQMM